MSEIDRKVIKDFGNEWTHFNYNLKSKEIKKIFAKYFYLLPQKQIVNKTGFDLGCGTGRWAQFLLPMVKKLNCIEPSKASINIAKKNLKKFKNVKFFNQFPNNNLLKKNSQDFGYCLGVLHHTTNTNRGIKFANRVLKKNGKFLLYLYYNFENKPSFYKFIWKISNLARLIISKLPFELKIILTNTIALTIYYPLAKFSKFLNYCGINTKNIPLNFYKDKTFYIMKTDSLDRFGTKLEKRFSKKEIVILLKKNGFKNIKFSKYEPFWTVLSQKS